MSSELRSRDTGSELRSHDTGSSELRSLLERIDGRPYGHYKDLRGRSFELGPHRLHVEHVQGDPFAAPSRLRIDVGAAECDLPVWALDDTNARRATADFLQRAVRAALREVRGKLEMAAAGPEVLDRTGTQVSHAGNVVLRVFAGLPAAGRRILGRQAAELVCDTLPTALDRVLETLDREALRGHVECVLDQVAVRAQLAERELVAFLAEGSLLPRRSGADPAPLAGGLELEVPQELAVDLVAPYAGPLRGLAIPHGVTLIVGGGYHGKSTLLQAIALAVYDHVPGDGRERCVTDPGAVSVRAEDGRSVRGADLRPFIGDLPLGRSTAWFETDDASGSTSQAAAIVESLEAGASALLVDEDTAATNFMIRDARMRSLIPGPKEPITPFLDRVRQLRSDREVSTVLVVGGAGDYLDVADRVIQMDAYQPIDATERARDVAREQPLGDAAPRSPGPWSEPSPRVPDPASLDASRGRRAERVKSVKTRAIEFGREEIDVSLLYQLVDAAQCRAIGDLLLEISRRVADGRRSLPEVLDALESEIESKGLDALCARGFGDRARPRRHELAAALNRLRTLRLVAPQA